MPNPGGTIYAIGTEGTSLVKIGCTTGPVENRLQSLQTAQPFRLSVLATVPIESDVQRIERQVHAFLAKERRRGEWFEIALDTETLATLVVRAVQCVQAEDVAQRLREDERAAWRHKHTPNSTIGSRIREARTRYGMSQAELARRIGISKTAMNDIEQGKTTNPGVVHIIAIADTLRLSVDALLGRTVETHA